MKKLYLVSTLFALSCSVMYAPPKEKNNNNKRNQTSNKSSMASTAEAVQKAQYDLASKYVPNRDMLAFLQRKTGLSKDQLKGKTLGEIVLWAEQKGVLGQILGALSKSNP